MPPLFRNKVVRDLAFVVSSPVTACSATDPVAGWCSTQAASVGWLEALDNDPAPLLDWIRFQNNHSRLGVYFSALAEFWVRNAPGLGAKNIKANVQVAQLFDRKERIVGALKLLFEGSDGSTARLESSIKFFMHIGSCTPEDSLADYVTLQGETLKFRLADFERKNRLLEAPAIAEWLHENGFGDVTQMAMLKGYLLYHRKHFISGKHADGSLSHLHEVICDNHFSGWWSQDLEELISSASGSSMFCITSKMHWLSTASVVTANAIEGQHGILDDCPVLTMEDFRVAVQNWLVHADAHDVFKPLPVIELGPGPSGELQEISRGFLIHSRWKFVELADGGEQGDSSSCYIRGSRNMEPAKEEANTTLVGLFQSSLINAAVFLTCLGTWAEKENSKLQGSR
jgi:hypothetical protein